MQVANQISFYKGRPRC